MIVVMNHSILHRYVPDYLVEEIRRWLHLNVLEVKSQRTAELIQTLKNHDDADTQGAISSEGEEEDDLYNNDV